MARAIHWLLAFSQSRGAPLALKLYTPIVLFGTICLSLLFHTGMLSLVDFGHVISYL